MNRIAIVIMSVLLIACEGFVIKEEEAKKTAEALLELIQNEEYEKTAEYYSPEYKETESAEQRAYKFEQLKTATGKRTGFELIESRKEVVSDRDVIILTYRIPCERIILKDILIIGLDEGKHLVLKHTTTNLDIPVN